MKKIFMTALAAMSVMAAAANDDPNRVQFNYADGSTKTVMVNRVESISFASVSGPVRADIAVTAVDMENQAITLKVEGTEDCVAWKYALLPETKLGMYSTDAKLASYIDANCADSYRSFIEGTLPLPGMEPGSSYALCVVALDKYQTLCEVSVDKFETPRTTVGNPEVAVTFENITDNSFDVVLEPNGDCPEYAYVVYPLGELESSYQTYGPQFGCSSIESYIKDLLTYASYYSSETATFDGLIAGTTYQVSVVPVDKDGNLCEMQAHKVRTTGGVEGSAWIEIEQGEYLMMQKPNPDNIMEIIMAPFQEFWFTPNEATARFRAEAFSEEDFNALGLEAAKALVCREPEADVPDDMWFRYKYCRQLYEFEPNTTGYVLCAGKNFDGEWGEVNILKFTTPASVSQAAHLSKVPQLRKPLLPAGK